LLAQGYTDQEVLDYFVDQYGVQVLLEPPKSGATLLLWVLPILALLAGGGWLFYTMRGWRAAVAPVTSSGGSAASGAPPGPSEVANDYLSQVEKDLRGKE
jgi:cytochrome c-type biogenesis protein CcmH